jgi:hypothetical protein
MAESGRVWVRPCRDPRQAARERRRLAVEVPAEEAFAQAIAEYVRGQMYTKFTHRPLRGMIERILPPQRADAPVWDGGELLYELNEIRLQMAEYADLAQHRALRQREYYWWRHWQRLLARSSDAPGRPPLAVRVALGYVVWQGLARQITLVGWDKVASAEEYATWCAAHGCDHAHCPGECERPQPFVLEGVLYCGKHWFDDRTLLPMLPCREGVCDERGTPG